METAKRTVILLSLVLFIAGAVQSAEKPAEAKISNTRFASCVVKITANPIVFPLNYEAVESLLRSSGVAGKAGREALGLSPEQSVDLFFIEPLPRDSIGAIPPEPGREPQRMGDDMMMGERMMRNEQRMMEDRSTYDEMTDESTRTASRRGRSESRSVRGGRRDREDVDLYGGEVRRPRVIAPEPPGPDVEQTLLFRLTVELPENVKPAAEEFMDVLIDLMRRAILDNARNYSVRLEDRLSEAQQQRERAQAQLSEALGFTSSDADYATKEQLDQIVDLSMLSREMPFGNAIEALKNSVKPQLKIIVLWRDLFDNVEIEQSTEINMDGVQQIRLGTALDNLLKAIQYGGGAELGYRIDHGVITIATRGNLLTPQQKLLKSAEAGTPAEMLIDQKRQLNRDRQMLEMDLARLEARHTAIEEQISLMNKQIMSKVEDDPVTHELQEIVDMLSKRYNEFEKLVSGSGRVSSPELEDAMKRFIQAKTELAKRRGELSKVAGGDQLVRFNRELATTMIDLAEKRAQLGVVDKQFKQIERQLTTATTFDPQVSQIRIAKQALEIAGQRVNELESLLAGLQEPTVTVFGAD